MIKFLLFLFVFAYTGFCAVSQVKVFYRIGGEEIVKKADFSDVSGIPLFMTNGRQVEINLKKIYEMKIWPDTIQIYHGDTWCRVDIYPIVKDTTTIKRIVHNGWMKLTTKLVGNADFGRLSASIIELTRIHFKPKILLAQELQKALEAQQQQASQQEPEQSQEPKEEESQSPTDEEINTDNTETDGDGDGDGEEYVQ